MDVKRCEGRRYIYIYIINDMLVFCFGVESGNGDIGALCFC